MPRYVFEKLLFGPVALRMEPARLPLRLPAGYVTRETLHHGANTVVVRTTREHDQRSVIFKCLRRSTPQGIERLNREVSFLRQLEGTGVCPTVLDCHPSEGWLALSDEGGAIFICEFHPLMASGIVGSRLLELQPEFPLVLHVGVLLSAALNVVHGHRIIHKDLKPSNFLYVTDESSCSSSSSSSSQHRIVLIDFDAATSFEEASSLVSSGTLVGTVEYMSPEQTGQLALRCDYRTDLYSLGVLLYQLASHGRFPYGDTLAYSSSTLMERLQLILTAQPTPLPQDIPAVFVSIVSRLLEKRPEQRYQSAFGLHYDLQQVMNERESLVLCTRDKPIIYQTPKGILGRESELNLLRECIAEARDAPYSHCVFLAGVAGVGKSSIVATLQRELAPQGYLFCAGKFDQYRQLVPYSAFSQAFTVLTRQISMLSMEQQEDIRRRLCIAVGECGQAVVEVFPELEQLLGSQPRVPPLPPSESQIRFTRVLCSLLRALATTEQPLVFFLDDMHWADEASRQLWQSMMRVESNLSHVLVICAYRSEESIGRKLLLSALEDVKAARTTRSLNWLRVIDIQPLSVGVITLFIQSAIKIDSISAHRLARVLHTKTLGNPLFLNRYLKALYEDQLLFFDWRIGEWTFDERRIVSATLADNAAQLLASSLARLEDRLLRPLLFASCIGMQFEVSLLVLILQSTAVDTVRQCLSTLSNLAFLCELDVETYRFCHDVVHTAAYSILDEKEKEKIHHELGWIILGASPSSRREVQRLEAAMHLNRGVSLVVDDAQRLRLAELELSVATMSCRSLSFTAARQCSEVGISMLSLLDPLHYWATHHDLSFGLHLCLATSCFAEKELEAERCFALLFEHASSENELLDAYLAKMMLVFHAGRHQEALAIGIECLSRLGMSVPFPDPGEELVTKEFAEFEQLFRDLGSRHAATTIASAEDTPLRHCIAELVSPAFFLPGQLCAILSVRGATLALRNGFSRYCAVPLVWMAVYFVVRGNHAMASDVGQLAVKIMDRYPDSDVYKAKVSYHYAAYIHWLEHPLQECVGLLRSASQLCLKTCDYLYASFAAFHLPMLLLVSGESIEAALPELEHSRQLLQLMQTPDPMFGVESLQVCFGALQAGVQVLASPIPYFSRPEVIDFEKRLQARGLHLNTAIYYLVKVFALYHLERFEDVVALSNIAEPLVMVIRNHFGLAWFYHSHVALAHLELWSGEVAARGEHEAEILTRLEALDAWARMSPCNLALIAKLVRARYLEVVKRDLVLAARLCEEVVMEAEERRFRYWQALGNVFAASIATSMGQHRSSRQLLGEACATYAAWGAMTCVAVITRRCDSGGPAFASPLSHERRRSSSSSSSPESTTTISSFSQLNVQLDAETILQVTRVLTQELDLTKLLGEVMRILTTNTSAEFICVALASPPSNQLEIVAQQKSMRASSQPESLSLAALEQGSAEIIRYVHASGEILNLENANDDVRFNRRSSATSSTTGPYSVLCLPVVKSFVRGVIYLENRRFTGAFSRERVRFIHAILPHIAICIENAQLVQRLSSTSKELEHQNEALRLEERRKNTFLAIITHELRTPLHGILGATSLLESTALNQEQREYNGMVRRASDSLMTLVNDVLDLTQTQSPDLRIARTHVALESLAFDVLDLFTTRAAEKEIDLEVIFEDKRVSQLLFYLDSLRVRQVLMNLVSNAVKFTERGFVLLSIDIEGNEVDELFVRFSVRDTGKGIAPEQLSRLFQLYSQLDSPGFTRFDGFGIGLYVCKRITDLLGGSITAASDGIGAGATFTVRLPASPTKEIGLPQEVAALSSSFTTLLWLEHSHNVRILSQPLLNAGIHTLSVTSLAEIQTILRSSTERVVIFTELRNVDALRSELKEKTPGIVGITYMSSWQKYSANDRVVPLLKPLRSGLALTAAENALRVAPSSRPPETLAIPTAEQHHSAPPSKTPARDGRILVVDDNPLNAMLLRRILEKAHYETETASNGEEALTAVERRPPDLILMDVQMPVMDGLAATQELRRREYRMPIIAASASFSDTDRERCFAAGMNDLLPKPFTAPSVLGIVKQHVPGS